MFLSGLVHRVNIHPLEVNKSNRLQKTQMRNNSTEIIEDVRCRISKHEKAIFESSVNLKEGDVIEEISSGIKYEVLNEEYVATGFNIHHKSYKIKKKAI